MPTEPQQYESLNERCRRVWVCKRCGNCLAHCKHKDESNFREDLAMPCSVKLQRVTEPPQTKPDLLDEQALTEIETWKTNSYGSMVNLPVAKRDALCQTVRAAWAQCDSLKSKIAWHRDGDGPDVPVLQDRYDRLIAERDTLRDENADLREQLAQADKTLTSCGSVLSYIYHRERSRLLPETQQQLFDTMREVEKLTRKQP